MNGKVLKIASNDLYGNVDERTVSVFAVFNHLKYMNKYIIFTFSDEINKSKLYYGSVHLKKDSLVIFQTNENNSTYINTFTDSYLNQNVDTKEYELIDISDIKKVELVSYNVKDFDRVSELDNLAIKKEKVTDEAETNRKPVFLYLLLIIMILLLGGVTYLYFNPTALDVELKQLTCNMDDYNQVVNMQYASERIVKFDKNDRPRLISITDTYKFNDEDKYNEFKDNNRETEYFKIDGEYKYNDETFELKIFYSENSIIDNYREMKNYLKNEGYNCQEGTYYE